MVRVAVLTSGGNAPGMNASTALDTALDAIDLIGQGQFGCLVGIQRGEIVTTPLSEMAGHTRPLDPRLLELARALAT